MTTGPLQLSSVHPDFESILTQLQIYLRQKATWLDTVDSGGGQTLLEAVSAVGEFNQMGIELAYREAFLETANRESSVYAISRMLGVRIRRKSPAQVPVALNREQLATSFTVPKYTQFDINGTKFFNRDPLVFLPGSSQITANLYQGEVKFYEQATSSTSFKELLLPEEGFVISDTDVSVEVYNQSTGASSNWSLSFDGIWSASSGDKIFYDTTSAKGGAVLMFGDGGHGALPPVGYTIRVVYAVTLGSGGQNSVLAQEIKALDTLEKVWGATVGPSVGGSDERNFMFYKKMSPSIFRSRNRCVTTADYEAVVKQYPGVADCLIHSQRDIAPDLLEWMNVVRICILPTHGDMFTQPQWDDFLEYMDKYKHTAIQIQQQDPQKINVDVRVRQAMFASSNQLITKTTTEENLNALFGREDTLNKRRALSDIVGACKKAGLVDYVNVLLPSSDLVPPTPYSWHNLQNVIQDLYYTER
jgi:hypothetical protein